MSPSLTVEFHKVNMESDLKSLQQKIQDLETKLQFTQSSIEEDDQQDTKKNVHFDTTTINSVN